MESSRKGGISRVAPLVVQLAFALTGMIGVIFAPPASGRMLLVPLTASAQARLPVAVLGHDALLLGTGPLPGSLVVIEDRHDLLWAMLRLGVLPLAASPAGCGSFGNVAPRA
jgi:hypothetical protein